MPDNSFTIDANIVDDRWTHDLELDHHDELPDGMVVLADAVGPYAAGVTLDVVLADMAARLYQLDNYARTFDEFTIDADITDRVFTIDAVISGTEASSFTIDADIANTHAFTIDADIIGRFTIDAFIV